MSRELGSNSGDEAPGTFGVVSGYMQLLLQLGIHRFADESQPIELLLRLLGTNGLLIDLDRGEQLHRAILLQEGLQCRVIVGSISQQTRRAGAQTSQAVRPQPGYRSDWLR